MNKGHFLIAELVSGEIELAGELMRVSVNAIVEGFQIARVYFKFGAFWRVLRNWGSDFRV